MSGTAISQSRFFVYGGERGSMNKAQALLRTTVERRSTDSQPTVKAKMIGRIKEEIRTKLNPNENGDNDEKIEDK